MHTYLASLIDDFTFTTNSTASFDALIFCPFERLTTKEKNKACDDIDTDKRRQHIAEFHSFISHSCRLSCFASL